MESRSMTLTTLLAGLVLHVCLFESVFASGPDLPQKGSDPVNEQASSSSSTTTVMPTPPVTPDDDTDDYFMPHFHGEESGPPAYELNYKDFALDLNDGEEKINVDVSDFAKSNEDKTHDDDFNYQDEEHLKVGPLRVEQNETQH